MYVPWLVDVTALSMELHSMVKLQGRLGELKYMLRQILVVNPVNTYHP